MPKISNYILTQIWNQNYKYFLILGIVFLILRIFLLKLEIRITNILLIILVGQNILSILTRTNLLV